MVWACHCATHPDGFAAVLCIQNERAVRPVFSVTLSSTEDSSHSGIEPDMRLSKGVLGEVTFAGHVARVLMHLSTRMGGPGLLQLFKQPFQWIAEQVVQQVETRRDCGLSLTVVRQQLPRQRSQTCWQSED
jgi:hypothetical protein